MRANLPESYVQFGVRLLGATYLVIGLIGFLPIDALNPYHPEGVGARYMFRFFAIDLSHNLIHLGIGLSGLWAARQLSTAQLWGKVMGPALVFLFLVGMVEAFAKGFPKDQLLFGLVALNSVGHTFHLATGFVALLLGLARPAITASQKERPNNVIAPDVNS